ncbi:MAG: hypothetical protein WAK18_11570 [Nocardioidaceae bacterium]
MTSPDTSPVMHNLEGHDDFDVAWPWLNQQLTPGITTVLRVKNESRSMPRVLPGMLLATDRVVVVDNQSDDGTADVARQVAAELGLSDRLVVKDYPFDVSRCGLEHLWTPDRSVHSLAYFYNWSFSHVSTTYSMKWDGDMVLTPEGVAILRDLGWQLDGDVLVTIPRHPLFVESESVAYLDRGTANIEPYVFPMASGYGHVKAFEWELRLHPEDITRLRLPEGLCVELKYLDSDEFAHWTAPDSFADSIRTGRKRREWEVFHGLAEGRWRELGDIERIEAPPGVNVIDYVTERWLPQSHRPVFVGGLEFPVTPGELPIDPDRRGPGGKLLETPEVRQGVRQPADTEEAVDIDGAATPARAARPAEAATVATEELPDASNRRVLMVAGSGRSGTSLLAGIAAQLGLYVPQPEISTDSSNPLGFSEPAWVVEFNDRLLRRELVEVSDARPEAWFTTTRLSAQPRARLLLFEWLRLQFEQADELVIKDPRLSWFLGMWRAGVLRTGAQPSFATMLRHPTEVVSSKSQQYPGPAGNTNRTAAWINLMLFTERATRGSLRTFIEYDDLLEDWARVVRPMGDALGLRSISAAKTADLRRVEEFVRPSLRGSHRGWDDLGVIAPVRDLAEEAWTQLRKLAKGDDDAAQAAVLDALRRDYVRLYAEAEGIVASSIDAAVPSGPPKDAFLAEFERSLS